MNATTTSSQTTQPHIDPVSPRQGPRASHAVRTADSTGAEPAEADNPPERAAVDIEDARPAGSIDRLATDWIAERLGRAIEAVHRPVTRVSVRLIDETQMKALHLQSLGDAIVTDVLSFDTSHNSTQIEADIAVCVDVAKRESSRRKHSNERELLLYALHGLLHCCGYDDQDEASYQAMHAEEDRILTAIGVGVTFGPGNRST